MRSKHSLFLAHFFIFYFANTKQMMSVSVDIRFKQTMSNGNVLLRNDICFTAA